MSTPRRSRGDTLDSPVSNQPPAHHYEPPPPPPQPTTSSYLAPGQPPVYASFSPLTLASSATSQPISAAKRLSTILVHQKSPLLLATPPQVTRALAYSHPFLLPLNKLAGLLTWTTADPWESFLLVAVFWAVVLYGDVVIRYAGPVVLVLLLIGGMYGRRFSPLSSSGWSEDGGSGTGAASKTKKARGKNNSSATESGKSADGTKSEDAAAAAATAAANSSTAGRAAATIGGGGAGSGGHLTTVGGGGGHTRTASEITSTKHQKTLDEIVETLKEFTARCNILLEPLLELTDFLSTQRTATSATTRPALMRLLVRILLCTPFWAALTLPPFRIVTTRRVMLCFGTVVLTWHARVVKAGRTILWRSASVRRLASLLTGLDIKISAKASAAAGNNKNKDKKKTKAQEALEKTQFKMGGSSTRAATASTASEGESELAKAIRRARGANDTGVRFTFIIYENQRRWVGLGWTNSLFAYERAAWTDEHNNAVPSKNQFELPEVEEDSSMRWRWVEGSRWRVDGVPDEAVASVEQKGSGGGSSSNSVWDYDGEAGKTGWVYYDNKWQFGRRGQDGWGRWTRRRKWYRDAELVEIEDDDAADDDESPNNSERTTQPVEMDAAQQARRRDGETATASATSATASTPGSERPPSLPPRPKSPRLAPPFTTTSDTLNLSERIMNERKKNDALQEIKEEDGGGCGIGAGDDVASVLSSSSRSMRFRMPSLRRRVTDSKSQQNLRDAAHERDGGGGGSAGYSSVTSSPRSGGVGDRDRDFQQQQRRSRRTSRTSEAQSEDEAASLERLGVLGMGMLGTPRSGGGDSWGVGDEVVMGLE
ncbi:integral peroxisomal membrane peroxin-domain-containing protein [Coniella lustricola]|uniref:Integral peroxisomal membrane peroxin-domain-containing protein n=1 Tax=Coniella lustricola TaxID=2025994 RepID=A0A2T3A728_9PEZI|nr:integral peroxisomal membrane peroxin-domain-containing protein [Coniella lustricola]